MNKFLMYTALPATALLFTSCFDEDKPDTTAAQAPEAEQTQAPETPTAPTCPTDEELAAMLSEQLPETSVAERGEFSCEPPQTAEDGTLHLVLHQVYGVKENLFTKQTAPEAFNELRKGVNDALNAAAKPDSVYLLQVGGTTEMLTDADRAAKPLPEDMQAKANELRNLAEGSVWVQTKPAGEELEVLVRASARYEEGAWHYADVEVEDADLRALDSFKPESAVTADGGFILTPESEQARKADIAAKIDEFNAAAEPYINSREDAARNRLAEEQAAAEEQARKAAEEQAAAEALRKQWTDACAAAITEGKDFAGEWTRANRFGELTLHIETAKTFDNSIQFIGTLYDTKLPEASLDIAGRCDLTENADGAHVDITIYDGRYDPDQPTAEVYDAHDGLLSLSLTQDGKLTGIMSCAAWGENSEKAFKVSLSPKAAPKKEERKRRK